MTQAPTSDVPPPRDAASLILLRDGQDGLEVLLLRRHEQSKVLGGMYVFPGGKLDAADSSPAALATLDQDAAALHQRLGEPDLTPALAAGLHLAALRESHEEAGVLLALSADGDSVARWSTPLAAAVREGMPLADAMTRLGLRWDTRAVLPWSRWVTPRQPAVGSHRFDTRFFLAVQPHDQEARHDDHEATEAVWLTPRQALERCWAREIELIPPQLMSLAELSRHRDVAAAWSAALQQAPRCIQPETFDEDGVRVMAYPGDPRHPLRDRVMPGPTRLRYAARRFEPETGFDGWFA